MDLDELVRIAVNFYYAHKWVVIIGAVILIVMILLKPKPTLKALGILVVLAVAVYIVSLIFDVTFTGMDSKEKMIHKSQ